MDPVIGQVILNACNFVPKGWHACDGSLLPISSNNALYSLLGTRYGGDGRTTFGLPKIASPDGESNYVIAIEGMYPVRQ